MTRLRIHPLTGQVKGPTNGHARPELQLLRASAAPDRRREVRAGYDAARDTDDFKNYWANADSLDADAANSRAARSKLVPRARYEVANNGYADGMVQTYATDLVGIGPKLRMQSKRKEFNATVEHDWKLWCQAVQFRRKLWCMAHAKVQDGEGMGLVRTNPGVRHYVKLDLVLIETEQCQTPMLPFSVDGYIDGIKFDAWGNPEWYDVLPYHPGGAFNTGFASMPERVPARYMLHWFLLRRPGQHRAVPEFRSTLNTGASSRRWREATVAAAETAADFTLFIKTAFPPEEMDSVTPMSTLGIEKRMMTALPNGYDPFQMKSEHPNATYEAFNKAQIGEQARPKSMPYNKAACDSSLYNYASGRLDHQTYYGGLNVEREDGNDLVLDPLFALWWHEAVLTNIAADGQDSEWWGEDPFQPPMHQWDWPKHPVADRGSEAEADDKELRNGKKSLSQLYTDDGRDFEEELPRMAADYGVTPDEMRKILRHAIFNSSNQQASFLQADAQAKKATVETKQITDAPPAPEGAPANA